jgi:hypothetical protein
MIANETIIISSFWIFYAFLFDGPPQQNQPQNIQHKVQMFGIILTLFLFFRRYQELTALPQLNYLSE